jgi:hypothetical protein
MLFLGKTPTGEFRRHDFSVEAQAVSLNEPFLSLPLPYFTITRSKPHPLSYLPRWKPIE